MLRSFAYFHTAVALLAMLIPSRAAETGDAGGLRQCKPGPWGHIEYQSIYIAAPDWILEDFPTPALQPRWTFASATPTSVREFLTRVGIDEATRNRWLSDTRCHIEDNTFTIYPSVQDLETLNPTLRPKIYRELAKTPLNQFHYEPVFIPGSSVEDWLHGANLPDYAVELVRKLSYLDGEGLFFSDFRALLSHADTDKEARAWLKALTRTRTVVAYLQIDPKDDIAALKRYWTANFHRKDSLPILDGLTEGSDSVRIDITHLLPPIPRKLVYNYTTPDIDRLGRTPNCHWTSLNFFNYSPQNFYLDLKLAASRVLDGYDKVKESPAFGDVLFFLDSNGNAYHSCVFIADDLVYTKNGENTAAPWIITRFEDVKQVYLRMPGAKIETYRRRWPNGT